MKKFLNIVLLTAFLVFIGCNSSEKTLKIAATPVPHADILEQIKPDLEKEGIILKIIEVDDYNLPNRLLFENQVDANFFQHEAFLDEQKQRMGFDIVSLVKVHIEPMGIFSEKITSLDSLKEGALVAIPNDPTNEGRALKLLADTGLIRLKTLSHAHLATPFSIVENPKNLKFEEIDAAFLSRSLKDVDLALIPSNFALQAKLNPEKDALALEPSDSPFANIIAVRGGEENKKRFLVLKKVLTSEKMRHFIEEKYKGCIIPVRN